MESSQIYLCSRCHDLDTSVMGIITDGVEHFLQGGCGLVILCFCDHHIHIITAEKQCIIIGFHQNSLKVFIHIYIVISGRTVQWRPGKIFLRKRICLQSAHSKSLSACKVGWDSQAHGTSGMFPRQSSIVY